jgi:hypothetical protein
MATETDQPGDALEALQSQDDILSELFGQWNDHTKELEGGDDVDIRWQRGSITKLLLDHLAVREAAKQVVCDRLREVGHEDLAARLEGDGVRRRQVIDRYEDLIKGQQAVMANTPDHDQLVVTLQEIFQAEVGPERGEWLPEARRILGPVGERGLPSSRWVRMHADTHPSPVPGWLDKIGPLKAMRAIYDHLRGLPGGGTNPEIEVGKRQRPGVGSLRRPGR